MRVLRVYHSGRNAAHRARDRALVRDGVEVTLVVPSAWPEDGSEDVLSPEPFPIVELPVERGGDVNRHRFADPVRIVALLRDLAPDVLDLHEEPFSAVTHQFLQHAPDRLPIVLYTAQNLDKRFPPPFAGYETAAYRRASALYPCSRQAASVARGKGFAGPIEVLPLGFDEQLLLPGTQSPSDGELRLALIGRLVPEKGILDSIRVLAALVPRLPVSLTLVGRGPERERALALARTLGVADHLALSDWQGPEALSTLLRSTHVVLVPSLSTRGWVEQFGRVIVEAHACGALVAGYDTGSIGEVAGSPALIVPAGAVDRLATEIATTLEDPAAFAERRTAGIALAGERSWSRVAERQAALYEVAMTARASPHRLPRSPRARRLAAAVEFGPPAQTDAGPRPFALPLLRGGGPLATVIARTIDATAELRARVVPH